MDKIKGSTISITSQKGNKYIYDASTNMIWPDTLGFSEIIREYNRLDKEQIVSRFGSIYGRDNILLNYNYIDALVKKFDAFYFDGKIRKNHVIQTEEELDNHLANINQIVLELTQACNLRCKYCLYSGDHEDFRPHDNKYMKEKIAIKSIDRFFSYISSERRTRKFTRIFINLYGGEPLLNINLIKKVVDHAQSIHRKKEIKDKLHFTISTNGMLLKDDILSYLMEKEFLLAISLDGPKEEHDKNRVTASGEGSFDVIWANLKKMMERDPLYFRNHALFLVTLNPNHDPIKIDKFFRRLFNEGYSNLKVSLLRDGNYSDSRIDFREKISQLRREIFKNKSLDLSFSPFLSSLLKSFYESIQEKKFLGNLGNLTGTCFPDEFRFFVSTTGEYHMCERINSNFSIGNYVEGIRLEKVKKIYEDYNEQVVGQKCNECVARNICSICFASAASGTRFDVDKLCEEQIKLLKGTIYDVVTIYEDNPKAFTRPGIAVQEDDILDEAFY